jgi:hypothetical protein
VKDDLVLYRFNPQRMECEAEPLKEKEYEEDLEDDDWYVYAHQ